MPKNVFNWTFSDIVDFLKKYNFVYAHAKGSHYYYIGNYGGKPRIIQVPFHGSKTLKPRTFKGIVIQSGIPLNIWLEK
jgi:predicted RNA binding protein YcfA (HicA-like mRNA interferase family)